MTAVAGNPGEYALSALNAATDWIPNFGLTADRGFIITGTFVGTVTLQVSMQRDLVKTRVSSETSYSSAQPWLKMPRGCNYFRFICSDYTSGTIYVSISAAEGPGGPGPTSGQGSSNVPAPDIF